jgi:hypothetical protein
MKEKLIEFIQRLRNERGKIPEYSELDTFEYIITPILNKLGWDTSTPEEVQREFTVGKNRVDRALKVKSKVKVLLEGKQVSVNLYGETHQLAKYFGIHSVEHAVLTNGANWWFYLPLKTGEWDKKRFYVADLLVDDISTISDNLIAYLSKDNIVNGSALENADKIYRKEREKIEVETTIPKAWENILKGPNPTLIEIIADETEDICEYRPDDARIISFLSNLRNTKDAPIIMKKQNHPKENKDKQFAWRQLASAIEDEVAMLGYRFKDDKLYLGIWDDKIKVGQIVKSKKKYRFDLLKHSDFGYGDNNKIKVHILHEEEQKQNHAYNVFVKYSSDDLNALSCLIINYLHFHNNKKQNGKV